MCLVKLTIMVTESGRYEAAYVHIWEVKAALDSL